jgi:hypothetical protein
VTPSLDIKKLSCPADLCFVSGHVVCHVTQGHPVTRQMFGNKSVQTESMVIKLTNEILSLGNFVS